MNVLVVFYSTAGETERLALALGVGAIQAHANIRLRRVPPDPAISADATTTEQRECLERLTRDYTAPRPVDAEWADALIVASSRDGRSTLEAYLEQLPAKVSLGGKVAAPVTTRAASDVLRPIYAVSAAAGLIVIPMGNALESIEARHAFGRRVVAVAEALKK